MYGREDRDPCGRPPASRRAPAWARAPGRRSRRSRSGASLPRRELRAPTGATHAANHQADLGPRRSPPFSSQSSSSTCKASQMVIRVWRCGGLCAGRWVGARRDSVRGRWQRAATAGGRLAKSPIPREGTPKCAGGGAGGGARRGLMMHRQRFCKQEGAGAATSRASKARSSRAPGSGRSRARPEGHPHPPLLPSAVPARTVDPPLGQAVDHLDLVAVAERDPGEVRLAVGRLEAALLRARTRRAALDRGLLHAALDLVLVTERLGGGRLGEGVDRERLADAVDRQAELLRAERVAARAARRGRRPSRRCAARPGWDGG